LTGFIRSEKGVHNLQDWESIRAMGRQRKEGMGRNVSEPDQGKAEGERNIFCKKEKERAINCD